MGQHDIESGADEQQQRAFTKALLEDVQALERMLDESRLFETETRHIGAEQEMFLVDSAMNPAPVAMQVLEKTDDPRLTTELARYNLEANASPQRFTGACLRDMHRELDELVGLVRESARTLHTDVALVGILPTLQQSHLSLDHMTPLPRYARLNEATRQLRGDDFHVFIKGLDELDLMHDNVMLEAFNTSFQVHFQVAPHEFVRLYNVAQAVTAPVLAAAVNAPLLLGQRLWKETRVALFQRSLETHTASHSTTREHQPRVSFGRAWLQDSILEIFREDIARFRVLMATALDAPPLAELDAGRLPKLSALRLHNGTVWRWNRPCYGFADGIAHLRIENRVLPSGPTLADEVANAAFFFGLMAAVVSEHEDVTRAMSFDDARSNFLAAARHGLQAQFAWFGNTTYPAAELILNTLLPMARGGLEASGIHGTDIDRYLGILEERVRADQTGARWQLKSLEHLRERGNRDQCLQAITASMLRQEKSGTPVHRWELAEFDEQASRFKDGYQVVRQVMSTDLFTVRATDLVDLAASLMDWKHLRHVPVEDGDGRLAGLVSHRQLLRLVARRVSTQAGDGVAVGDIMNTDLVTVSPETRTLAAIGLMREHKIGCLPVVEGDRLVGILTAQDLIVAAAAAFERSLEA